MAEVRPVSEYHEEVMQALAAYAGDGSGLRLPPPACEDMQPRVLDHMPRKAMTCTFLAEPRFANAMDQMMGGYLSMACGLVFSMFATLTVERPCTSVTLNTHFMRPLPADNQEFSVEVRLRGLTRSVLFLEAKVANAEDKTIATATTTMQVVKR